MKSIAILPLRKGSKGIPGKNKRRILGRPLYQWVLGEAIFSDLDEIYVFSDDLQLLSFIKNEYEWTDKVKVFERSEESASDTASTELAMLELAEALNYNFDIFCLLQATSPLTKAVDINNCLESIKDGTSDSALTVVNTKRFIWSEDGEPINYDVFKRPRRQDFNGLLMENGAVYVCTKLAFLSTKNRISGKIGIVRMPEETLVEIDEESDFLIVEQLLENDLFKYKRIDSRVKVLVLDIDGVMTNGTVLTGNGEEIAKAFSLRDGMGISFLSDAGIIPIVMTSEDSKIVDTRISKLGISYYYKYTKDKFSRLNMVLAELGYNRTEVAYVGDDINDLANLLSVGWSFAPANATSEVKSKADFLLHNDGGDMAVREAIEKLISLNKRFK